MYDITTRDLNWPTRLSTDVIGTKTARVQDEAGERALAQGQIQYGFTSAPKFEAMLERHELHHRNESDG